MKVIMHPDCYNPQCLNKETQCDKCREYVPLPPIESFEQKLVPATQEKPHVLRPLNEEKLVPPYMEVKDGFGYLGALMYDEIEDKVQCHVCGELLTNINAAHLKKHGLNTREYKEKFGLNIGTSLATPTLSTKRSIRGEFMYKINYGNLTSAEVSDLAHSRAQKSIRIRRRLKRKQRLTVEMMNKYGTCPKQIEERFIRILDELEHTPSWDELYQKDPSLLAVLSKRFKGYSNALVYFGLKSKKKKGYQEYGLKNVQLAIRKFVDDYKRLPNPKDTKTGILPDYMTLVKYFGDWWKVKEFAYTRLALNYPKFAAMYSYDENLKQFRRIRI